MADRSKDGSNQASSDAADLLLAASTEQSETRRLDEGERARDVVTDPDRPDPVVMAAAVASVTGPNLAEVHAASRAAAAVAPHPFDSDAVEAQAREVRSSDGDRGDAESGDDADRARTPDPSIETGDAPNEAGSDAKESSAEAPSTSVVGQGGLGAGVGVEAAVAPQIAGGASSSAAGAAPIDEASEGDQQEAPADDDADDAAGVMDRVQSMREETFETPPPLETVPFEARGPVAFDGATEEPQIEQQLETSMRLFGGAGDDVLRGGGLNDVLVGRGGDDRLFGRAGRDVAEFSGTVDQYRFDIDASDRLTVADAVDARDGVDTLSGVEVLRFGDGVFDVAAGSTSGDAITAVEGGANDVLVGGGGSDALVGSSEVDRLFGGSGDDSLRGGGGDDRLDGGAGSNDVAEFSGNWRDYTIEDLTGGQYRVTHKSGGSEGVDTLTDIERIRFTGSDGPVEMTLADALNDAPSAVSLSASSVAENAVGAVIGALSSTDADGARDAHAYSIVTETTVEQALTADPNTPVTIDYGGSDGGKSGTGLRMNTVGRIDGGTGDFVFRLRNSNDTAETVEVREQGGAPIQTYVLPPNSETFFVSDYGGSYRLFYSGSQIDQQNGGDFTYVGDQPVSLPTKFEIVDVDGAATLRLKAGEALDFETDGPSVDVLVTSKDANGATTTQTLAITVADVAEALTVSGDFADAGVGETSVSGDAGDQAITGTNAADDLRGGGGDDALTGGAGDDVLMGGAGNDVIDGGSGGDTAQFSGSIDQYSAALDGTGRVVVTDGVAGRDGADALTDVESASFNGDDYTIVGGASGADVLSAGAGARLAVYTDNSPSDGKQIVGRFLDAAGAPTGSEFVIQAPESGANYEQPRVAALADGRFAVTWSDVDTGAGTSQTRFQIVDASGTSVLDAAAAVQSSAYQYSSSWSATAETTALDGGDFVVAWSEQVGGDRRMFVEQFDASGGSVGGPVRVNELGDGHAVSFDVVDLGGGAFGVLWGEQGVSPSHGAATSEMLVRTYTTNAPGAPTADGPAVEIDGALSDTLFGTRVGLTQLSDGNILATWQASNLSGFDGWDGYFRVLDSDLQPVSPVTPTGTEAATSDFRLDAAALPSGGFVVGHAAWRNAENTNSIELQIYDSAGQKVGGSFDAQDLTHNHTIHAENEPRLEPTEFGFNLLWTDYGDLADGDKSAVMSLSFDEQGNALGPARQVNVETTSWQWGADTAAQDAASGADLLVGGAGDDTLSGGAGDDRLFGGADADLLLGGVGADALFGEAGSDDLRGGAGDDLITGGAGDDAIDGGSGSADVAVFSGEWSDYTISSDGAPTPTYTIAHKNGGADGTDTVTNVETYRFSDGSGGTVDVAAADLLNEAPSSVALSAATVAENAAGATIGTLSTSDSDANDDHSYSVDDVRFEVVESGGVFSLKLKDGQSLNFEDGASISINVTATDAAGAQRVEPLTITVSDVAEALTVSGDFTDAGVAETSITGGGGDDKLTANASGGQLTGGGGRDQLYGGAGDDALAGGDDGDTLVGGAGRDALHGGAGYDQAGYWTASSGVTIDLTDGSLNTGDAVGDTFSEIEQFGLTSHDDVFVGDAEDQVVIGSSGRDQLSGGGGDDRLVGGNGDDTLDGGSGSADVAVFSGRWSDYTISSDGGSPATYTIVHKNGGADGTDTVTNVEIFRFSDGSGGTVDVAAADLLNDAPSSVALSAATVAENAAGATIGTLSTSDSDANDVHRYSVDDGRFEVVESGGVHQLKLKDGQSLNFEDGASISINVTATDAAGAQRVEPLTITVSDVAEDFTVAGAFVDAGVAESVLRGRSVADDITGASDSNVITANGGDDIVRGEGGADRIEGNGGADTLYGGQGDDLLVGYDAVSIIGGDVSVGSDDGSGDTLYGDAGADRLYGGGGDDVLTGGADDDKLDGGAGTGDVAVFSGQRSEYTITSDGAPTPTYTVTHDNGGSDGVDTVTNVEIFRFSDGAGGTVDVAETALINTAPTVSVSWTGQAGSTTDQEFRAYTGGSEDGAFTHVVNGARDDADDLSGTFDVSWDASGLTITASIVDDVVSDAGKALKTDSWRGDTIEVYLDLGGEAAGSYDGNDMQYVVGIGTDNVIRYAGGFTASPSGATSQSTLTADGYDLTFTVTWASLGISEPTDGQTIGFGMGLNDNDDGGERDTQMMWETSDSSLFNTPSQFGTLTFVDHATGVDENQQGLSFGTVTVADADVGDTVTVTVDDARFEVVGGELRLKAGESLDFETDGASHLVTVMATDAAGASSTAQVAIDVRDIAQETITGTDGADTLTGSASAEALNGRGGDDAIDGGGGADTVVYAGAQADYAVSALSDGGYRIVDANAANGDEGVDTIRNVEAIQFSDGVVTDIDALVGGNPSASVAAETATHGRVGHWSLGDGSGAPQDQSATDNHGVLQNGASYSSSGPWTGAGAVSLDGSNDYVEIANDASYELATGSISLWFNPDASGGGALFSRDSAGYDGGGHLVIWYDDNGAIRTRHQDDASNDTTLTTNSGVATQGSWNHVVYSWGPSGVSLTINGQELATSSTSATLAGNSEPITLGASQMHSGDGVANSLTDYFSGDIAEFAVFSDRLTAGEAADLYYAGAPNTDGVTVAANNSSQELYGGTGDDDLNAGDDNDVLSGGAGDDTLEGGWGDDTIRGGAGDDTITDANGTDDIDGGAGDDDIDAGDDNDTISGGDGDDTIESGWGDDTVDGGAGDDTITDENGDDRITGGAGDDVIDGGDDDDTAVFSSAQGDATIGYDATAAEFLIVSAEGVDRVKNVETFEFDGSAVSSASLQSGSMEAYLGGDGDDALRGAETAGAGRTLVVYESANAAGTETEIFGKIVADDGSQLVAEFSLSSGLSGLDHATPLVTALTDGSFAVAWDDKSGGDETVRYQIVRADGTTVLGSPAAVQSSAVATPDTPIGKPAIASLSDGGFVVVWEEGSGGTSSVYAQRYDGAGAAQGSAVQVDDGAAGAHEAPVVHGMPGDGFVVVWNRDNASSPTLGSDVPQDVMMRVFDTSASGAPTAATAATQVDTQAGSANGSGYQEFANVAVLDNGNIVVSWESHHNTDRSSESWNNAYLRVMSPDGTPVSDEILVNVIPPSDDRAQDATSITPLVGGGFVVVYENLVPGGSVSMYDQITAQRFDDGGVKIGGEITVSQSADVWHKEPVVEATADGGFRVVWHVESGGDADGHAVLTRGFDSAGAATGGETVVNATTTGDQNNADTARSASASDASADIYYGGAGDDVIVGGSGVDTAVFTGASTDYTVSYDAIAQQFVLRGPDGTDTLTGVELFKFDDADVTKDQLRARAGSSVDGTAGDDTLIGGASGDVLTGGAGDDRIIGGAGTDTAVFSGASTDYKVASDGAGGYVVIDLRLSAGDDGVDWLVGVETLSFSDVTGAVASFVSGDAADFDELGAAGDQSSSTGAGAQTLYGGAGDDQYFAGDGDDTLYGGSGNDTLQGQNNNDTLYGGSGDDTLYAHGGNDAMFGDGGRDRLYGDAGRDVAFGGSGDDEIWVHGGDDVAHGGDGADKLYGDTGADSLFGGAGNDEIRAGDDHDDLYGGAGDDALYGDGGTDTAHYSGAADGYVLSLSGSDVRVEDQTANRDGTDTLQNIEHVSFEGEMFDLSSGATGSDAFSASGATGATAFVGGDGADTLQITALSADQVFHGGSGASWTDAIELNGLNDAFVAQSATTYQTTGWTLTLDSGSISNVAGDQATLTQDAAGRISFASGDEDVVFTGLESLDWSS